MPLGSEMSASKSPRFESTRVEVPGDGDLVAAPLPAESGPQPTPAADGDAFAADESAKRIGRYRVERRLGQGGFGAVYLAMDDELNRRVAIKVPRRMANAQLAEYREEAQKLAKLEHPGVVPFF